MYQTDKRTVITLDAGGTNFVFGAIRGNQDVIKPISLPSNSQIWVNAWKRWKEDFGK